MYDVYCVWVDGGGGVAILDNDEVRPVGWAAGLYNPTSVPLRTFKYCSPLGQGIVSVSTGGAQAWSDGVNLSASAFGATVGLDLYEKTEISAKAILFFQNTNRYQKFVCGQSNLPGVGHWGQVQADYIDRGAIVGCNCGGGGKFT